MTFQLRTKARPASQIAILAAMDLTWRNAMEIASRAPAFSPKTVRNNLEVLVEERAVEVRIGAHSSAPHQYRLPDGGRR